MNFSLLDRLPPEWASWTLENIIRGVPISTIRTTLVSSGFSTFAEELEFVEGLEPNEAMKQVIWSFTSYQQILLRRLKLRKLSSSKIRKCFLDTESFFKQHYCLNEPVILQNIVDNWSLLSKWSPGYFRSNFGQVEVEVQTDREADVSYEINLDAHRSRMRLADFVDLVDTEKPSNNYYMCANNRVLDHELRGLFDEIPPLQGLLDSEKAAASSFLWFGPQGTITPFHYDLANVLLIQVFGEKEFVLAPPEATPLMYNDLGVFSKVDYFGDWRSSFPLFERVPLTVDVLKPGEALFIPVGWWHTILAKSTSISLSFTNFVQDNNFRLGIC